MLRYLGQKRFQGLLKPVLVCLFLATRYFARSKIYRCLDRHTSFFGTLPMQYCFLCIVEQSNAVCRVYLGLWFPKMRLIALELFQGKRRPGTLFYDICAFRHHNGFTFNASSLNIGYRIPISNGLKGYISYA